MIVSRAIPVSGSWVFGYLVVTLIDDCIAATVEGCSKLDMGGSVYQKGREGSYTRLQAECYGRPVYEQSSGHNYIFYMGTTEGWQGWMIGTAACENKGGVAAESASLTPEGVQETWEEVDGGDWVYNPHLAISCHRMSAGSIVGIIAGVLIVGSLVAFFVLRCKGQASKRRQPGNNGRQNTQINVISNNRMGLGTMRPQIRPPPGYRLPQPPPYNMVAGPGRGAQPRSPGYSGPRAPGYSGYNRCPGPRGFGPPPAYQAFHPGPHTGFGRGGRGGGTLAVGVGVPPPYYSDPAYPPVQPASNSTQPHHVRQGHLGDPPKVSD